MKRLAVVVTGRLLFWLAFLLAGCGVSHEEQQDEGNEFRITGTWELHELLLLSGQRVDVNTGYEHVWYRFYEDDGTYYVAELTSSDNQEAVKPHEMSEYFFMMSPYDTVYIEHGRMTNLNIMDNHTIGIDRGDYVEIYVRNDKFPAKSVSEIERTVECALRPNSGRKTQYIVPKLSETSSANIWIWLIVLGAVVCGGSLYIVIRWRAKHEQSTAFIHSDYFLALRQRLYEGPALKQDEWEELEIQMMEAYPMFFRRLAEMGQLSEVELRVCMLTKLGIPPSAIAIHTYREYSSISSIRSRLYYKLFGEKGGAKELDEFIRNL
ncbi:MAG: hypothetical protein IJ544_06575 [Prevotella sp.]|nr:hypothetical protein [Prevotella sp.]